MCLLLSLSDQLRLIYGYHLGWTASDKVFIRLLCSRYHLGLGIPCMNQSILDIIQLNFTLIGYGHRN
jgi:hypothetical protein